MRSRSRIVARRCGMAPGVGVWAAHVHCSTKARNAKLGCDARHLKTDEVVCDQQAPELLRHGRGTLAANGLEALEHVRLDLAEPELDLPALVIEDAQLYGRIALVVGQGREQSLRLIALALVPNGARLEMRRQRGILSARLAAHGEFH